MSTTIPTLCQRFRIDGMSCGHCEQAVQAEVLAVAHVIAARADARAGTITIECTDEPDVTHIADAVDRAGYRLIV